MKGNIQTIFYFAAAGYILSCAMNICESVRFRYNKSKPSLIRMQQIAIDKLYLLDRMLRLAFHSVDQLLRDFKAAINYVVRLKR